MIAWWPREPSEGTRPLRHPERVTHLILYGAYCRGALARPGYDAEEDRALVTLVRKGWGRDTPVFAHYFPTDPEVVAKAAGAIDRFLRERA